MFAIMDDQPRIKASIWVQAQLRLCDRDAIPFVVMRRGDPDAGAILIKLDRGQAGFVVLARGYDENGRRAWTRATGEQAVSEADADAYLERQVKYDPDIWIVAVEDALGRYHPDDQLV
jgi:hypothetical protein